MNNLKTILLLAACCCAVHLSAQNPFRKETFYLLDKGDTIRITGAYSGNNDTLSRLKLESFNFPTITLPRSILKKVVDVSNSKSSVDDGMLAVNSQLRQLDTLNRREIASLRSIIDVQQKNIDLCEQTNVVLNRSIASLNDQLNSTRDLAKASNKQTGGKLWAILIGGGLGFGLGVLLGVIAN
jgi:hypothetical protein